MFSICFTSPTQTKPGLLYDEAESPSHLYPLGVLAVLACPVVALLHTSLRPLKVLRHPPGLIVHLSHELPDPLLQPSYNLLTILDGGRLHVLNLHL